MPTRHDRVPDDLDARWRLAPWRRQTVRLIARSRNPQRAIARMRRVTVAAVVEAPVTIVASFSSIGSRNYRLSVGRSLGRSVGRSVGRSIGWPINRTVDICDISWWRAIETEPRHLIGLLECSMFDLCWACLRMSSANSRRLADSSSLRYPSSWLPVRASLHPSISLSVRSSDRLFVHPSVCTSVRRFGRPCICPTVRPSVRPSGCLSRCPCVYPSVRPSVRTSGYASVCPSILPAVQAVHQSIYSLIYSRLACHNFLLDTVGRGAWIGHQLI